VTGTPRHTRSSSATLARVACVLALPAVAWCQFRDLATTSDGSRLFFISALRQHGTTQPLFPKILALDGTTVSLVYQPPVPGPEPFSQYSVGPLQAASDGAWVVYGTQRNCIGGSSCFLNEQRGAALVTAAGETEALGANARFSRDGRWLLTYSSPGVMASYCWLVDRRTAARTDLLPIARPSSTPVVMPTGAVLIPAYDRLVLWDGKQTRTLAGGAAAAVMDDAATTVVYQEREGARLRVIDLASGKVWPLGPGNRENFAPALSADGAWVLYLSRIATKPQVFLSRRDGSDWRQLTDLAAGVREATLSADGRVAWVAGGDGAVLRVDTHSGAVEQRIAPTPVVLGPLDAAVGSAVIASGSGLAAATEVRVGGRAVESRALGADRLLLQIPWEFSEGETELEVAGGDERFDAAVPFTVRAYSPTTVAAIHEDFGALVTDASPVRPGEILHLYATGLGPVDAAGRTTLPWEWSWLSLGERPAEVLFAGLAPGLPGFYQVDVRVPATVESPLLMLAVKLTTSEGGWFQWGMGNWSTTAAQQSGT
jgi:uncharacterized protein (TIGR03437 family)